MDAKRLRAIALFGACLASKLVRDATDPDRVCDSQNRDVVAAIAELRAVDRGELSIDDAKAVTELLLTLGIGAGLGSRADALRKRCEADGDAARRWMQAARLVAPALFREATGTPQRARA